MIRISLNYSTLILGCHHADDLNHHPKPPAAEMREERRRVHCGERHADDGALYSPLPHGVRHRRPEVERVGVRVRSVRRIRWEGEETDDQILQLVLLLNQRGIAVGGDGSCLCSR